MGLIQTWLGIEAGHAPDAHRRLKSVQSFWTWQRYIGLAYAKQSTTVAGKGLHMDKRETAFLEPAVELYLALGQVVDAHQENNPDPAWDRFGAIIDRCLRISWHELQGVPMPAEEAKFLNSLDLRLKRLTRGKDQPIVVDVHTEPSSQMVVEEGIGRPQVVRKTLAGKEQVRGALFTHYEFKQSMSKRLTNQEWRTKLADGEMAEHRSGVLE
jgi:hypothetical protein